MYSGIKIGPTIHSQIKSWSTDLIIKLGKGEFSNGYPSIQFPLVDVRDYAQGLLNLVQEKNYYDPIIINKDNISIKRIGELISYNFGSKYGFPTEKYSTLAHIIWRKKNPYLKNYYKIIYNKLIDLSRDNQNVNLPMHYRSLEETLKEAFLQQIQWGNIKKK